METHMNTERKTDRSETTLPSQTPEAALSDKALDHVVGGINPQPLPPHDPHPTNKA